MNPEEIVSTTDNPTIRAESLPFRYQKMRREASQPAPPTKMIRWVVLLMVTYLACRFLLPITFSFYDWYYLGILGGLMLAQLTLLGIWMGAGIHDSWKRFYLAPLGIIWVLAVYLGEDISNLLRGWDIFFNSLFGVMIFFGIPVLAITLCCAWHCSLKRVVRIGAGDSIPLDRTIPQYAIRHLLIATTTTAVLITFGRAARSFFETMNIFESGDVVLMIALFAMVGSLGYVTLAVMSLWACLGNARLAPRLGLVTASAVIVATLALAVFPFDKNGAWVFTTLLLISTSVVVGFLLLVRRRGYRLVPLKVAAAVAQARNPLACHQASPGSVASELPTAPPAARANHPTAETTVNDS